MTRPMKRPRYGGARPVQAMRTYQPRYPQGEWKYADFAISTAVNNGGSIGVINALAPGTGASQRIGVKVTLRSIEMRLVANCDLVGGLAQTNRFLLLMDRQANAAAPNLADFLNPATYLGIRNLVNRKRFRIMLDKAYELTPVAGDYARKNFKIYMKFRRGIIVEYNNVGAGTIADIVTNAIHFVTIGSEAAGNTDGAINGVIRIRYTDM